jgi:hypothetical protein
MILPLHVGIEHPSLLWIAATALLAFVVGLGINLYCSLNDSDPTDLHASKEKTDWQRDDESVAVASADILI